MNKNYNKNSLNSICASLCYSLGIEKPIHSKRANKDLVKYIDDSLKKEKCDRVVMYNPDAIAEWIYFKYHDLFKDVLKHIEKEIPLKTVMPSVTPVCFATMYTGVDPKTHGIKKYEKPVLKIETIFDSLIKSGLKPVIIAEKDSSLSMIFNEREMDYFIYDTIDEVNKKAIEVIKEDKYDFIVIYNGNYDEAMHHHSPEGKEAIEELKNNIRAFDEIASLIEREWTNHNTLLSFAMDHGCHEIDGKMGSHGLEMVEDINIRHLYRCYKKVI